MMINMEIAINEATEERISCVVARHPILKLMRINSQPLDTMIEHILLAGCEKMEDEIRRCDAACTRGAR